MIEERGNKTVDQPSLELFAFWRTSATYRVRVALNLKGLHATEQIVDIDAGEHRSAVFLQINPLGAIPALIEGSHSPLTQSLAILEYLDELKPTPPLLPADLHGRARVRSLALMLAADTHPLITPRVKGYLTATAGFDLAAWRAWQIHWFTTGLQAFEQRLVQEHQTGAFCHGDQVTTADVCLASILAVMEVFKITVAATPTIDAIVARCQALEAFAKADPFAQQGAPPRG
jgi:maleylacetoacetate isomerase